MVMVSMVALKESYWTIRAGWHFSVKCVTSCRFPLALCVRGFVCVWYCLFLLLGHLEAHADMVHCFKRSSDSTIVPFNLRALTVWNI